MAINKVQYGDQVIIDITDTSATPEGVLEGQIFYNAAGVRSAGILNDVTQNSHGLMSAIDKLKLDTIVNLYETLGLYIDNDGNLCQ